MEKNNQKIINLNPVFINQEKDQEIQFKSFYLYIVVIIQLLIIIWILYYYFSFEIIFIINSYIKKTKDVNQEFIDKINNLYNYTYSCNDKNIILTNDKGNILAKYFDGNIITFQDNLQCEEFLNRIKNN